MDNPIKQEKKRSLAQNASLHRWCEETARELNNSGISKSVFYQNIEADYTMENIKELWRSFARTKYGKNSTTELTTKEFTEIYEECNRHLSQFGLYMPFPSEENTSNYLQSYENNS